jgi:ADP-dependent NAD(P)H-hydrate dehydratase / NAD(P)H-hydrate epimerase
MKLVSIEEMKEIETEANQAGMSFDEMMENAGRALGEFINSAYSQKDNARVFGLVGPGKNGGDTLIALTHLATLGWETAALLVGREADGDSLAAQYKDAGGRLLLSKHAKLAAEIVEELETAGIVLDGILGTGTHLPLKTEMALTLKSVGLVIENLDQRPIVVAVDCPTGVDCNTGQAAEECLRADVTVCMAAVKHGLLRGPAFDLAGQIVAVDIGFNENSPTWKKIKREIVDWEWVAKILPERKPDAHKGTYGTALIVAGSINFTGAALLAAQGAYRSGVGLVTLAVPSPLYPVLAGQMPEATWLLLPNEQGVISEAASEVVQKGVEKATALLLGPGWGLEETTQKFLESLLGQQKTVERAAMGFLSTQAEQKNDKPIKLPALVVDADGLKLVTRLKGGAELLPASSILTPHPGEMAILTGLKIEEIQADRMNLAEKYAREWNQVVVLKGACTVIAGPGGETAVIPVATSALAKAGTGDVLAGLITGLRAQGMDAFQAAAAGAWIHAQAGLLAAEEWGSDAPVMASEVALAIGEIFARLSA